MKFDLNEDQRALVDMAEKFAASASARRAEPGSPGTFIEGTVARWQHMAELGLTGLLVEEEAGGIGMGIIEAVLVAEALGQSLAQEPFISGAIVAPTLIASSGRSEARSEWLQAISTGHMRIALACDERILDFDPAPAETRAERRNGGFQLFGAKELVIDGTIATHFVVTALLEGEGANAFLVSADDSALQVNPIRGLDGGWLARVSFNGAVAQGPLFDFQTGLAHVARAIDLGIVALCGEALGIMNRMLALTANYLQTRYQFGKPIGSFQALQHRFADMVVAAEQARSGTIMAMASLAGGDASARQRDVSAAKALICRHGRAVAEGAIQLHGGIGITDEYELSRYVRRMIEIEKTWGDLTHHENRFTRE